MTRRRNNKRESKPKLSSAGRLLRANRSERIIQFALTRLISTWLSATRRNAKERKGTPSDSAELNNNNNNNNCLAAGELSIRRERAHSSRASGESLLEQKRHCRRKRFESLARSLARARLQCLMTSALLITSPVGKSAPSASISSSSPVKLMMRHSAACRLAGWRATLIAKLWLATNRLDMRTACARRPASR